MNKRLIGVIIFALLVSAVATVVLYRMISARVAAQAAPASARLLVASRDLTVGTLVKDLDIKEIDWPGALPEHAIANREEILDRGVVSPIYTGEPFLPTRLAAKGAGAGLAATIPPGKRAVAIRVNDVTSVAGFVTPGMRVDVLILGTPPNGSQAVGTQTKTLLQNMEVLSAGQQIERDKEGKPVSVPVVNMLVTPEQAEVLSLASQDARIQLVLRNPLDTQEAKPPGTAMANLWTGAKTPAPRPAFRPTSRAAGPTVSQPSPAPAKTAEVKVPPVIVQVMHGSQKQEIRFQPAKPEEK